MKALLVLEDGTHYIGKAFGDMSEACGEVVFNTCMTGYQEILTDPSYKGQIVVMTYPLIGNYGFNFEDNESFQPHVQGFIVKELCDMPSNWRNTGNPDKFFRENHIVGLCDIDTRHLTQHIRCFGSMAGIISSQTTGSQNDLQMLAAKAQEAASKHTDLVSLVSTKTGRRYEGNGARIAVLDLGVKENILRSLKNLACDIRVVPATASSDDILSLKPDGILFSNGPGDPMDIPYVVQTASELIGKKPIMGICLGHQVLGLALGGKSYKLKFGHHGGNHPVKDLKKNRIYITSQNHNYALRDDFSQNVEITHINFNDKTVEGFSHRNDPVIGIQYHPEASPGPSDSGKIFEEFLQLAGSY
jgi:carbamoyl-phosphate synthase small subunit